mmetsp:Transcript_3676/g.8832  ORF Transcript_3676/g.8832 Transcript_3676/m.8832 type:complete len:284 (-) Transcript_3676:245-1096(-)
MEGSGSGQRGRVVALAGERTAPEDAHRQWNLPCGQGRLLACRLRSPPPPEGGFGWPRLRLPPSWRSPRPGSWGELSQKGVSVMVRLEAEGTDGPSVGVAADGPAKPYWSTPKLNSSSPRMAGSWGTSTTTTPFGPALAASSISSMPPPSPPVTRCTHCGPRLATAVKAPQPRKVTEKCTRPPCDIDRTPTTAPPGLSIPVRPTGANSTPSRWYCSAKVTISAPPLPRDTGTPSAASAAVYVLPEMLQCATTLRPSGERNLPSEALWPASRGRTVAVSRGGCGS